MTQKLNWSKNDVANTATHSYRVEIIGSSHFVIYNAKGEHLAFKSSEFDSKQAAKQWAENYNRKYGVAV